MPANSLFRQGEDDHQAYYIVSGKARLERSENGHQREIREIVGPGPSSAD